MWNYSDRLPGSAIHGTKEEIKSHYKTKLEENWLSSLDIGKPIEEVTRILTKKSS